ncbi:MAG: hypothetical protein HOP33_03890 [Verrucomicrobia bacterium]|nr:hypothetical protein [Verrucomicrobiota bacterium]
MTAIKGFTSFDLYAATTGLNRLEAGMESAVRQSIAPQRTLQGWLPHVRLPGQNSCSGDEHRSQITRPTSENAKLDQDQIPAAKKGLGFANTAQATCGGWAQSYP